ncbi:unnamed protein product [marine sediment metagenome]|uniref:Uncharacterized protein n=1 Tax=marine sediment metagenome TaxID=412755 RepID=X1PMN2_9ZZZZ
MTLPSWEEINKSIATLPDWKAIEEDYEKGLYKKPIGGAFNIRPYSFEEDKFQKAYREMAIKQRLSLDPDDPKHQYDWRALYKEKKELVPDLV